MEANELRKRFLDFFSQRGHTVVPSSSLLPDDPSVLLTTAGMQQFKKYFTGEADPMKDFGSKNTTSIQKSFRTSDIDEVGDESHLTFFEMLGHFSFGGYFKKETIAWTFEFLTKMLDISPERITATVFQGDDKIPFDQESYDAWLKFLPEEKIKRGLREDNVWGPAGSEGPCGAANEVYVDDLEVATLVFMEYYCDNDGSLTPLPRKGVDVGWGLERLVMIVQDKNNIFETDLFAPFITLLPAELEERKKRIIVDHLRGAAFLLADGVRPSNKEAGYILRRLLRRILAYEYIHELSPQLFESILLALLDTYGVFYPELARGKNNILNGYWGEWERFHAALVRGLKELERCEEIDASVAFRLYESFGLPYEVIKDQGRDRAFALTREAFDEEFKKHQAQSKIGQEKKFGGHGLILNTGELKAGTGEEVKIVTRLHTATHLLQAALRVVLGPDVEQRGSDITAERTRFDFSYPRKLTHLERQSVQDWVNDKIKRDLPMQKEEMAYEEAIKSGALHFFKEKYPERVVVYTIKDPANPSGPPFSRELCGGPHVSRTGEIGHFRIAKEEAVSSGTRRIRAVVE
jgi:alanyl-tRNA synthetase